MKHYFEINTTFAASKDDVVHFLQDGNRFLATSGSTDPSSIEDVDAIEAWRG